jgi:hypothetical protein
MTNGPETISPLTARQTLASLEQRLRDAAARRDGFAGQREALAFDAHSGLDAGARKRLDGLNQQALTIAVEIENFQSAIAEARRRILAADEAARLAVLRGKAHAAREKLVELRQLGETAGEALHGFVASLEAFYAVADDIRRLEIGGVSRDLIRVNAVRCVQSELMKVRLNSDVVPPSERRDFGSLVDHWAAMIEARIADVLGPDEEAA